MKHVILSFFVLVSYASLGQDKPLAKPSSVQYDWHEQERLMFIHFGMATWQKKEYDDGNFDLSRIIPTKLDTDDWCEVAKSWGAKQIIFVAKHVGGFCWWPTMTTEYCVRNIPWKDGKGDLLSELAVSCKKAGLKLGIYIYPGDVSYGAGLGSGGKTEKPALQEAYNKVFRQQLTEVLTRYGTMTEVWFDGSCVIDVSDVLAKHASQAVILQGPQASIRWPGTESGRLFYPVWNSVASVALKTGVSTQYDDDPDGDAWAPLEADIPLYNHNWFWAPENEKKRRTLEELLEIYYKSVGYGGVLLINASPDTTGSIVAGDKALYSEFGKELDRRFGKPLGSKANVRGSVIELKFAKPQKVNHTVVMEDYREGHRIRNYKVEGLVKGKWELLEKGTSVGRMKIDTFDDTEVSALRLTVEKQVNTPMIRSFKAYYVDGYTLKPEEGQSSEWKQCGEWDTKGFTNGKGLITLDLSSYVIKPGQYEVKLLNSVKVTDAGIDSAELVIDNGETLQLYLTKKDANTFFVNRTAQVDRGSSTILKFFMYSSVSPFNNRGTFVIRERSGR
jgi:alpha-L-fucosidase